MTGVATRLTRPVVIHTGRLSWRHERSLVNQSAQVTQRPRAREERHRGASRKQVPPSGSQINQGSSSEAEMKSAPGLSYA